MHVLTSFGIDVHIAAEEVNHGQAGAEEALFQTNLSADAVVEDRTRQALLSRPKAQVAVSCRY
jgi:hypothetical protein